MEALEGRGTLVHRVREERFRRNNTSGGHTLHQQSHSQIQKHDSLHRLPVYTRSLFHIVAIRPSYKTVVDPCNSRSSINRTLQHIKDGRDYSHDFLQASCRNNSQGVLQQALIHVGRFPTVALRGARKVGCDVQLRSLHPVRIVRFFNKIGCGLNTGNKPPSGSRALCCAEG